MGVLESRRCSTFRTHFRIRKMKKVEMTSSSHLCIKKNTEVSTGNLKHTVYTGKGALKKYRSLQHVIFEILELPVAKNPNIHTFAEEMLGLKTFFRQIVSNILFRIGRRYKYVYWSQKSEADLHDTLTADTFSHANEMLSFLEKP